MPEVDTPPKKRSALGFLKSAFIQEMPEAVASPVAAAPRVAAYTPPATPVRSNAGLEKAKKNLQDALAENSLDSYDYLKFKNATQELASDIPDEKKRFKTVFSTAKVMGITKEKLIQTAQHYITVLDEELKQFNEALVSQNDDHVGKGEEKLQELSASLTNANAEIQKLQELITSLTAEHQSLAARIDEDKTIIETSKANFMTAQATMIQDIQEDISKLSTYL